MGLNLYIEWENPSRDKIDILETFDMTLEEYKSLSNEEREENEITDQIRDEFCLQIRKFIM